MMTPDEAELVNRIEAAKADVNRWQEAATALSLEAAQKRAENQGAGRGLGGMLFGAKYRAVARRAAAISNAAIAKDVAEKRARIAVGKKAAQERVRSLKTELAALKARAKGAASAQRQIAAKPSSRRQGTSTSLDLLTKLKEAHSLGLLTDEEYETKRAAIAATL